MKTILYLLSIIVLFASCEDVIEVDLDSAEQRTVIVGSINDAEDVCTINITKTSDYFDSGSYPAVIDAKVTITDNNGNTTFLEETEPGKYTSSDIQKIANNSYTLNVLAEGKEYNAEVILPKTVNIDSLNYEPAPSYFGSDEDGYMVNCYFRDPFEVTNFYRVKVYSTKDSTKAKDTGYLFNDDFVEGNQIYAPWDMEFFQPEDTVVVELLTINKSTYEYYKTMFAITGLGMPAANPANPNTNLSNDALGYFGAYTISRDTIVIRETE